MKKRIKNITIIAAAYTGTLFGAGFVSGQEILRFFASWGSIGLVGTLLAGAGFALVGIMIMLTARRLDTQDYEKIISPIGGIIPKAVNFLMSFWLFGIITVMLAAAGELFETVSGLHPLIGSSIMTLAVMSVHIFGKEGFTKVFSFDHLNII